MSNDQRRPPPGTPAAEQTTSKPEVWRKPRSGRPAVSRPTLLLRPSSAGSFRTRAARSSAGSGPAKSAFFGTGVTPGDRRETTELVRLSTFDLALQTGFISVSPPGGGSGSGGERQGLSPEQDWGQFRRSHTRGKTAVRRPRPGLPARRGWGFPGSVCVCASPRPVAVSRCLPEASFPRRARRLEARRWNGGPRSCFTGNANS